MIIITSRYNYKFYNHNLAKKIYNWLTILAVREGADCPKLEFLIFIRLLCSTDPAKIMKSIMNLYF